ncbi:hypothetical protein ACFFUB_13445 [Algimonas porphyrae]|uniref:Uncharacterized protein n=1 Tax=Algimonas porphyrae TaxID=1128113 RepID=A0ABQ5UX44_9PROT|nr:hypothetical protein [Algimonas porphyrae]GLQ19422.1 hypothetical protein GCM10007854_03770 [Algimonas porphyrae]
MPQSTVCCAPPPVVYVDRVKTVTVEKPVEKIVEVEKIVHVDKIVEVEKPVYVEVPAQPTVCCTYPEPPAPIPHQPIRK